jgi:hypothetical protein
MKLKPLDLIIIKSILTLMLSVLIACFVLDFYSTLKFIGCMGIGIYIAFILSHIALCFPLAIIFVGADDIISYTNLPQKSYILYKLSTIILGLGACFIVYFLFPLIAIMAFNGSIDYSQAIETFKLIMLTPKQN